MESPEETKRRIIKAAEARFSQYSFGKTTMAEIAKDCKMSAANLYRFFPSKEDIAVEIGNRCMASKEQIMRSVAERPGLSAGERLEAVVVENLRFTYDFLSKQRHLSDIVETICGSRGEVMKDYKKTQRDFFAGILEEGV
ncbi:MAG TPA: TetR/AcrR family transcriptional regulator, partial [Nitrospiria bacterium]|nr:TetR/AcrR family transcriptional regulator [Nitrospiria bacterium]